MKGQLNLIKNKFDEFTLAVVDKKGCPIISQALKGSFSNPEMLPLNTAGTILAPVINVFKVITGDRCTPFYTGSLPHPDHTMD